MQSQKLINEELGLTFDYWQGQKKNERVFLAQQILKELGYSGSIATLVNHGLTEGVDKKVIYKKDSPAFFEQLVNLKLTSNKVNSVAMLYESGVYKLMMQSRKQIGKDLRDWLSREVLPTLFHTGSYTVPNIHDFTEPELLSNLERPVQVQNSKDVNKKNYEEGGKHDVIEHNIKNCILSTGHKPAVIKAMYPGKKAWSAKETLRHFRPEQAAAMSFNDRMVLKHNVNIDDIQLKEISAAISQLYTSLLKINIRLVP
jgi:prophage antirepressor-like protein